MATNGGGDRGRVSARPSDFARFQFQHSRLCSNPCRCMPQEIETTPRTPAAKLRLFALVMAAGGLYECGASVDPCQANG
jgi:hypothetical protein